jgi:hypothetical protein
MQSVSQFHLGTTVQKMALRPMVDMGSGGPSANTKRLSLIYAGLDGSIGP